MRKAQKAFLEVLDGYTLADVVQNKAQLMKSLNVA
jgi:Rrf2 family nitric oxide-sensitive transcriptional repressor